VLLGFAQLSEMSAGGDRRSSILIFSDEDLSQCPVIVGTSGVILDM
jgi:hypothetical protein